MMREALNRMARRANERGQDFGTANGSNFGTVLVQSRELRHAT
jgi:hypothetical protein